MRAALDLHYESLRSFGELGNRRGRAITIGNNARIRAERGELDAAVDLHKEALKVYENLVISARTL